MYVNWMIYYQGDQCRRKQSTCYKKIKVCTLPYLTLPYLTLPYLTLPYLTLPYLTLPYLTLPYLTLPYLTEASSLVRG